MNHIKLFEDYNNELYIKISSVEFNKGIRKNEPFSNRELSDILEFIENINQTLKYVHNVLGAGQTVYKDSKIPIDTSSITVSYQQILKSKLPGSFLMEIIKCDDYWFFIKSIYSTYFKCDDLEGVKNCIRNIIETKFHVKIPSEFGHENEISESKKGPNFKKIIVDDFVVYQGRDAESNDYVTLDLANDDDYWFHAKGVPGSHVVVKIKDKIPTQEIIKKIAEIAAKNCKSKENKVKVVYCKKKFVKKEKGMNPGQVKVDYNNASEIIVSKI